MRKTHIKKRNEIREAKALASLRSLLANGVPRNSAISFVMANHPVPYRLVADHLSMTQSRVVQICKRTPCDHKTEGSLIEHFDQVEKIAQRMGVK